MPRLRIVDVEGIQADDIVESNTRHLFRAGGRGPIDGPMLESAEASGSWRAQLIAQGIAEKAPLPADRGPFLPNGPVDFVRACLGGPVNRPTLEMSKASSMVRESCSGEVGCPRNPIGPLRALTSHRLHSWLLLLCGDHR